MMHFSCTEYDFLKIKRKEHVKILMKYRFP